MPAGVDDVDDALDADVEHDLGRVVEGGRAVDVGEVMHLIDAAHGGLAGGGIADVASDEFEVAVEAGQASHRAAGIVVEYPHALAPAHQRLDQRGPDEAAAAGHQDATGAHRDPSPASGGGTSTKRPETWARRAASRRGCA